MDHIHGNAIFSSSPPCRTLTHISMICSNVGIIDPEQLLQWELSFFFSSVCLVSLPSPLYTMPCVAKAPLGLQTEDLLRRSRIPGKTPHKWSSLHLRRLRVICFHYFDNPFLKSSPLQPPFASLSLSLSPTLLLCPYSPPFIWSSSRVRCSDVFQSQLSASEDMRRGRAGGGEAERHFLT